MYGCSRLARIWRSLRKRRTMASVSMPRLQDLDGHALLKLVVAAHGQIDRAHAAAAQLANRARYGPILTPSIPDGGSGPDRSNRRPEAPIQSNGKQRHARTATGGRCAGAPRCAGSRARPGP